MCIFQKIFCEFRPTFLLFSVLFQNFKDKHNLYLRDETSELTLLIISAVYTYCLGIPLTLVTVTNIAKFASESVFLVHFELWKVWLRIKMRKTSQNNGNGSDDNNNNGNSDDAQIFSGSEDEQVQIRDN